MSSILKDLSQYSLQNSLPFCLKICPRYQNKLLIDKGSNLSSNLKKKGTFILHATDWAEEDATVMMLIKDIGSACCLYSWFCFLKEECSLKPRTRSGGNPNTLLKAWTLVRMLSSLAHNWNSDRQVFFPFYYFFFSPYFTVNIFSGECMLISFFSRGWLLC